MNQFQQVKENNSMNFFDTEPLVKKSNEIKFSNYSKTVAMCFLALMVVLVGYTMNKPGKESVQVSQQSPYYLEVKPIDEVALRQEMAMGNERVKLHKDADSYLLNKRLDINLDTAPTSSDLVLANVENKLNGFYNSVTEYQKQMSSNLTK